MQAGNPRSLLERVVGACWSLALAAAAIYLAARLIESVWLVLVAAAVFGVLVVGFVHVIRARSRGW